MAEDNRIISPTAVKADKQIALRPDYQLIVWRNEMNVREFEDLREHCTGLEDISADDAFRIMEEDYARQEMARLFNENGDPYEDFFGNPW